jgi:hypothetical protein
MLNCLLFEPGNTSVQMYSGRGADQDLKHQAELVLNLC